MEREIEAIKEDLYKICWYMRGGVTISEVLEMDYRDRVIIGRIIEENLETTKNSGLPFF
jgi:hypothetical protein